MGCVHSAQPNKPRSVKHIAMVLKPEGQTDPHIDVVHTGDSVQAPQETTWRTFGEGLVKMRGRSDPNSVYDFTNLARRLNITRAHIVHHSSADLAAVVLNAMDWHEVWLTQCTTVAACSALGLEAIVRHLVTEAGCSATEEGNPPGAVALNWAARSGSIAVAQVLILQASADCTTKDSVGQFPLALAAGRGHVEFVKWLVQFCAADVEETDLKGHTALHMAAARGCQDVVSFLVKEANASVHATDLLGNTVVVMAAVNARWETVKLLIEHLGARATDTDQNGNAVVHRVELSGKWELFKWLGEQVPSSLFQADANGDTPLHLAATCGEADVVKWLIESMGANPWLRNNRGRHVLSEARSWQRDAVVAVLEAYMNGPVVLPRPARALVRLRALREAANDTNGYLVVPHSNKTSTTHTRVQNGAGAGTGAGAGAGAEDGAGAAAGAEAGPVVEALNGQEVVDPSAINTQIDRTATPESTPPKHPATAATPRVPPQAITTSNSAAATPFTSPRAASRASASSRQSEGSTGSAVLAGGSQHGDQGTNGSRAAAPSAKRSLLAELAD